MAREAVRRRFVRCRSLRCGVSQMDGTPDSRGRPVYCQTSRGRPYPCGRATGIRAARRDLLGDWGLSMLISQVGLTTLSRTQITSLLFGEPHDLQAPADCLFVFGGSHPARVSAAVALFNAGIAPYILFSGGTRWGWRLPAEAIAMRGAAQAMGVPGERILVECESNNTKENVLASLLVLDRALGLHRIRHLLAVSAPYHMRRSMLTLRTYMPPWITHIWCPANDHPIRPGTWWLTPESEQIVLTELRHLVNYVCEGQLIDEDVGL